MSPDMRDFDVYYTYDVRYKFMRSDSFVREKRIFCGENYMEVDLYSLTGRQIAVSKTTRAKRYNETSPKQKNLNEKKSRRYFTQLLNCNFGNGDYHITCTYSRENLPQSDSEADKEVRKYIRRISDYAKKNNFQKPKYVIVTSFVSSKTGLPARVHHHIVLSCPGLNRDIIENLWRKPKRAGEKKGKKIGHCNCDVIDDLGESALAPLASYLCRQGSASKRWTASVGLKKPYYKLNDDRYSREKLRKFALERAGDCDFWQSKYPGWVITNIDYGIRCEFSEVSGWGIYLQMRRADELERLCVRGKCAYPKLRNAQESCVGCPVFDMCRVKGKGL